jgi:hypothetical protein
VHDQLLKLRWVTGLDARLVRLSSTVAFGKARRGAARQAMAALSA